MLEPKIRVLFISSWFPDKENPTLGNFVEKHVNAVSIYCYAMVIHVAFTDFLQKERFEFECKEDNNIPILRIYISRKGTEIPLLGRFLKFLFLIKAYLAAYRYMLKRYGKPDLLHANIFYPISWVALLYSFKYKIPFLFTEHWTGYMPDDPNKLGFLQLIVSRLAARKAKKITVVSTDLQKAMESNLMKGEYQIIYNVVDHLIFKLNPDKKLHRKTRFIHISSLNDEQKNITGIIKTIYQLSLKRSDFELYIIGDGDARPYIKSTQELGIFNTIVFFEAAKSSEKIAFAMQNADCLLMFSNYESFSVVIAEALACGLPVIATKAGGLANELSEEYGIFISPKDEVSLMLAMNRMIEHHLNYNSKLLSDFANRFSYENVGKSFFNLYHKILNQK